jgi:hypothetical protein
VAETHDGNARHTDDYFAERNLAEAEEASIQRYASEVEAVMARMLAVDKVQRRHRKAEKLYAERARAFHNL